MDRILMESLQKWKNQTVRMPLLLRGARQVGKTFLIETFGKTYFEHLLTINFEFSPEYKVCFESLDPEQIVKRLTLISGTPIIEKETLLFLDEIQDCPQALLSLRYFKERMPSLHVIAAGSLLEFILNESDFRMPVGRIQSLYLRPLSFYEYLDAIGKTPWKKTLQQIEIHETLDPILHDKLLDHVREYMILGGMPAVIQSYLRQGQYQDCQEQQAAILDTYRSDFGKYAKKTEYESLQLLFSKAPGLIGRTIKYAHISPDIQSRVLKRALQLLVFADLIRPIHCTRASGLPLSTYQSETLFKLLFLDVGLMQYTTHLSADILLSKDILLLTQGAIAEQFVGQELLSLTSPYEHGELFYWQRDKPGSTAEVDYVTHIASHILPIEVKSGKTGRLRSLQVFLEEKKCRLGIRCSQASLSYERNILSVPLYMIAELKRLQQAIGSVY